ncbi:hypothetical protein NMD66_07720 [Edwardsiella tarda]|uniref:excisionase n=1 Tax=Edwardsiella tarda TaxID=636 RepID=UPI00351C4E96
MTTYLTIQTWVQQHYGDKPPCVDTVRRWIRRGYIYPQPYRHGGAYRIQSDARYLPPGNRKPPKPLRPPPHLAGATETWRKIAEATTLGKICRITWITGTDFSSGAIPHRQ